MTATPNHALQRTAPGVTACAPARRPAPAAFPHRLRRPPQSLSLGSLGDSRTSSREIRDLGIIARGVRTPGEWPPSCFRSGRAIERADILALVRVSWLAPASRANDYRRTARVRVVAPVKGCKPRDVFDAQDDSESLQSGGTYLIYAVRADGRLHASRWVQATIWNHPLTSDDNEELRGIREHIAKVATAKRKAIESHPNLPSPELNSTLSSCGATVNA